MQKTRTLLLCGLLLGACGSEASTTQPTASPARTAVVVTPSPRPATATFVPTAGGSSPAPTRRPAATSAPAPTTGAVTQQDNVVRLEDRAWAGGWRNSGASVYGGRTATWVYGSGTQYSRMTAQFNLAAVAGGQAELQVEGMDSEDAAKTQIVIAVNDQQIFRGSNPLPNDDLPLDSGTWTVARFPFDAGLLRAGANRITITNSGGGAFGRPPFFMLDYAELVLP